MLCALSEEGAEYLVVGAYALAAHGYARATGDIDIWVRPAPGNALRVMAALRRFGAPLFNLTPRDLEVPGTVFQMGVPPGRIDVMTSIQGVGFDEAWTSRVERERDGMKIPFLGREALIRNKRSTGRTKDLADAEALERTGDGRPPPAAPAA
jgi:hypothetical protein